MLVLLTAVLLGQKWREHLGARGAQLQREAAVRAGEARLADFRAHVETARHRLGELAAAAEGVRGEQGRVEVERAEATKACVAARTKLEGELGAQAREELDGIRRKADGDARALRESYGAELAQLDALNRPDRERLAEVGLEVKELEHQLAELEVSRMLYHAVGDVSAGFLDAFFKQLEPGRFKKSFSMSKYYVRATNADPSSPDGLWFVDQANQRKVILKEVPAELMGLLADGDQLGPKFPRGGHWDSCAVVGWSSLLMRYGQGAEIDGHDAVFRFNDAQTEGYEAHVGRKTTVRLVDDAFHLKARRQSSRELVLQHLSSKATLDGYAEYRANGTHYTENLHLLAPDFAFHMSAYMKRNVPSGFYGVALAMQKCRKVTVYGMAGHWNGHLGYHYYDRFEPLTGVAAMDSVAPMDDDALSMALIVELSRRSRARVAVAEPCQSAYESVTHECADCTRIPLSAGAFCRLRVPLPVAKPGWCQGKALKHAANCFRECKSMGQCPGGDATAAAGDDFAPCPPEEGLEPLTPEGCPHGAGWGGAEPNGR